MGIEVKGLAPLLEVFDMPASIAFYRDKLGFRVTGDSGGGDDSDWVMLELGGAAIMLNTGLRERLSPGTARSASGVGPSRHLHIFRMPRRRCGLRIPAGRGRCSSSAVGRSLRYEQLYLTDPDNYGLCFQWPAE